MNATAKNGDVWTGERDGNYWIIDHWREISYFTPPEAQVALLQFDQGQPVKPFKTTLTKGTESTESKCGLAATHPNFVRKKYKVRNRKVRIYPKREREFGLRKLVK